MVLKKITETIPSMGKSRVGFYRLPIRDLRFLIPPKAVLKKITENIPLALIPSLKFEHVRNFIVNTFLLNSPINRELRPNPPRIQRTTRIHGLAKIAEVNRSPFRRHCERTSNDRRFIPKNCRALKLFVREFLQLDLPFPERVTKGTVLMREELSPAHRIFLAENLADRSPSRQKCLFALHLNRQTQRPPQQLPIRRRIPLRILNLRRKHSLFRLGQHSHPRRPVQQPRVLALEVEQLFQLFSCICIDTQRSHAIGLECGS